jgi:hypothetical protein
MAEKLLGMSGPVRRSLPTAYDTDAIRNFAKQRKCWVNIPTKTTRKQTLTFRRWVYRQRNHVERFFNRIKQIRRIATRYDRRADNYLAALKVRRRGSGSHQLMSPCPGRNPALKERANGKATGRCEMAVSTFIGSSPCDWRSLCQAGSRRRFRRRDRQSDPAGPKKTMRPIRTQRSLACELEQNGLCSEIDGIQYISQSAMF